jgi:hypothetical protein
MESSWKEIEWNSAIYVLGKYGSTRRRFSLFLVYYPKPEEWNLADVRNKNFEQHSMFKNLG